jgi:hypothetical protein
MQRCGFATVLGLLAGLGSGGCGNGGGKVDAAIIIDIDNGSCGDQLRFTGEYVDWDTDASFCGIGDAFVEEEGGDGAMDSTAPNGRFDLCIPRTNLQTKLVVTQPSGNSQCSNPPSGYSVKTMLVAHRDVILAGGFFSGRAFTTARQDSFYQAAGIQFDSNKAHVFVHVNGTAREVSLAAAHAPAQAVVSMTWAPGSTGRSVFFPNVEVGGGTTTLMVAGGAIGAGSIPLVAGTITNVSVLAP